MIGDRREGSLFSSHPFLTDSPLSPISTFLSFSSPFSFNLLGFHGDAHSHAAMARRRAHSHGLEN